MTYDRIIGSYKRVDFDDDLFLCPENQVVFQKNLSLSVPYAEEYFEKYVKFRGTPIANKINEARLDLVTKFHSSCILDIGIGSGEFITKVPIKAYGYDVNEYGRQWLRQRGLYVDPYQYIPEEIDGITCWDVLEHMQYPSRFLDLIKPGQFLFASLPIIPNILKVRKSRHFRPNEHYYYFTKEGFIQYLDHADFDFLEHNDFEIKAGREQIETFAFLKRGDKRKKTSQESLSSVL